MVTKTSSPRSSSLALPAAIIGVFGLAVAEMVRAPVASYLVAPLAIFAVVGGHVAAARSRGGARWIAIAGLMAGYLTLGTVVAWVVAIELN